MINQSEVIMASRTSMEIPRERIAEFWMNLQAFYDIEEAQKQYKKEIESIHSFRKLKHAAA
ncbi:MAG: hypothetical protein HY756_00075 [Nitrospirae bacterium]|nr:hypothetical protein [Nitrospirota bacterium]